MEAVGAPIGNGYTRSGNFEYTDGLVQGAALLELPLPPSTRAGRGPAFTWARAAVEAAKKHPQHVAVRGDDELAAQDVAGALVLLCAVISDRTPAAWEACDLARAGLSQAEVAAKLGITRQAVGQRLAAAHWREEAQARPMLVRLLGRADVPAATAATAGSAQ